MSEKKVLVTGGTGFIGSCLTTRLIESGYQVRVLVRENSPNAKKLEGLDVEIAGGDICDVASVAKAVEGVNKVFHCAAVASDWAPKKTFYDVNVTGTENILAACVKGKVDRYIGISTNDVFGVIEDREIDESLPLTRWNEPYPDTKILADELMWKYHREHGLAVTTLYPCWVYGVNDTSFMPHIVEAVVKKDMVFWRKDALMWPVYIENLLDLLLLVAEDKRAVGNGYLIHDGKSLTFREFCGLIADDLKLKRPNMRIPYWAAYVAAVAMEGIWKLFGAKNRPLLTTYVVKNMGSKMRFSIKKAENELGWKPKTSFEDGFAVTMEWIRKEYAHLID